MCPDSHSKSVTIVYCSPAHALTTDRFAIAEAPVDAVTSELHIKGNGPERGYQMHWMGVRYCLLTF